jgi:hypothetical protein
VKRVLIFLVGSVIGTLILVGIASAILNYHVWGL